MTFCIENRRHEYVKCRDDDDHQDADAMGLDRLAQCEWGWHPGRDPRVPHVPSFKREDCQ